MTTAVRLQQQYDERVGQSQQDSDDRASLKDFRGKVKGSSSGEQEPEH